MKKLETSFFLNRIYISTRKCMFPTFSKHLPWDYTAALTTRNDVYLTYSHNVLHLLNNIGINHGFLCSNIRWITRKVFEHKAAILHFHSNQLKSHENYINNVKSHQKQRSFFNVGHFVSTKHMTSRRIDQ